MEGLSLRIRIAIALIIVLFLSVLGTSTYIYFELRNIVLKDAGNDALNHINRSVQMFMVSTRKFHQDFNATDDPGVKGIILADWRRTIFAVDEAVIHDFGEGKARVRLIGDAAITGMEPLGGKSTEIRTEFEKKALEKLFSENTPEYREQTETSLNVSIPLRSSVHPGCAQCHTIPVDEDRIMGSLNVYLPLEERFATIRQEVLLTGLIMFAFILFMIILIYLMIQRLFLTPLKKNVTYARKIADGDLSEIIQAPGNNEISTLVNSMGEMAARIRDVTGGVKDVAGNLLLATEELNRTTDKFSDSTQSQATSVEQVMATLEEVSAGMDNIASNTAGQNRSAATLMERMKTLSESIRDSGSLARNMLARIEEAVGIARKGEGNIGTMNETMSSIRKSSQEMTQIVEIITGISEQINLLSLNASIEAARAGDAGRGFAVVADQISRLADQTASSIKNIDGLIRKNDEEMVRGESTVSDTVNTLSEIIRSFDSVTEMVRSLTAAVDRQLVSNDEVNSEASSISEGFGEIALSTDSQRSATGEIVLSVEAIGQSTQSIAEGADFLSSQVRNIRELADTLKSRIEYFKAE